MELDKLVKVVPNLGVIPVLPILVTEEQKQALTELIDREVAAAYREGYNDNARDCNCNLFSIKPHQHLMHDGKSHDIKPSKETAEDE